ALGFRGSKSFAAKFAEHRELLDLSYELATIKTDVPLEWQPNELVQQAPDTEALIALFKEYEFRNLLAELTSEPATNNKAKVPTLEVSYETLVTEQQLTDWVARLANAPYFALDTETTSLNYRDARLVGISFAVEAGKAAYVPFGHDYIDAPEQLDEAMVLNALKPLLEDANLAKVGQNLKYDANVLKNHGIELRGIEFDTMLESYVLNSVQTRHDMDSMANFFLDHATT